MISDQFSISMDEILKNNPRMVETFDREQITGSLKRLGTVIHFCFGTGNGLLLSALASPGSLHRSIAILAGLTMIVAGELLKFYYKKDLAMLLKP